MKKFFKEWRVAVFSLSGVLILGFLLRILSLTKLPIFADEAIYVRWSQVMANEPTLRFLPLSDGKQPLFMWILMFIINYFKDPLFAGRFISVLSGLGTSLGIFTFSYFLFKRKNVALFSVFLYCLSPFAVFFDRMALVDSLLSVLGIWTFIFAYLSFKQKRLDFAMISGMILGLASLTKSPAIFLAALLPLLWLIVKWNKKLPVFLGVIYFLAFGMYNIQRLGPNFHLLSSRTSDYVYPISHIFTNTLDPLVPHLKDVFVWFWKMGPGIVIGMWLFGLFMGFNKYKKELIVLSTVFLGPVVFQSEIAKAFTARYIFYCLPFFFITCGLFVLSLKEKFGKYIFGLGVLVFTIWSMVFNFQLLTNSEKADLPRGERSGYLEEWTAGQGIKEVADFLIGESKSLKEGEKLVVGTEGYFGTLPDGLQIYLNNYPNILAIGTGLNFDHLPTPLKESLDSGNKTYFLVNNTRLHIAPEKLGLSLIDSYPKAIRLTDSDQYAKYGPQEELLFFELHEVSN